MLAIARRNASESPLLRLPGEIRNNIYAHILTGWELRVVFGNVFKTVRLEIRDSDPSATYPPRTTEARSLLACTRVCRQIHDETALLLFQHVTFVAKAPEHLCWWAHSNLQSAQFDAMAMFKYPASSILQVGPPSPRYYISTIECNAHNLSGTKQITFMGSSSHCSAKLKEEAKAVGNTFGIEVAFSPDRFVSWDS
ncbi:hypothetical protein CC86DRAFT_141197 [Ophiobolus disseminans]|uniref:DUF7730 domain-containing protein n=1 Tax=Ophiobolus disseminans TaxID=1469910 RepID=A0A6A7AFZ0_9PLEO|nr:hypothetical protein CC86DRAFT_141197 [Ophiobolus disseminans]